MKAIEQYFPVALFIMPHKVVLGFESVDKMLSCDHSNKRYRAGLSCGAIGTGVRQNNSGENSHFIFA